MKLFKDNKKYYKQNNKLSTYQVANAFLDQKAVSVFPFALE